jgi:uncharacterized membrane protein YuzA (DUF378 family)
MVQRTTLADLITSPTGGVGVLALVSVQLISAVAGTLISSSALQRTIWLAVGVIGLILAWIITLLRQRKQQPPLVLVPEDQRPPKHRGLILLVGTGRPGEASMDQSALTAIKHHLAGASGSGLEYCWLIPSSGERGSVPVALKLEQQCKDLGVKQTKIVKPVDFLSVQDTYDCVQDIYARDVRAAGLQEQDVIADFTGGTKPMSAGMILACGERRTMQYVQGRKAGTRENPVIASLPMLIEFVPLAP